MYAFVKEVFYKIADKGAMMHNLNKLVMNYLRQTLTIQMVALIVRPCDKI